MRGSRLGLLLALSLVFVAMGVIVAVFGDWRLGVGTAGFFGLAALVFFVQRQDLERLNDQARVLPIRGGVPIQQSMKRRSLFIGVMLGAGVSSVLVGYGRNPLVWWSGLALMVGAVIVFVLQLFGVPARRAISFSPEGIHFLGGPAPCLLHFDNIAQLQFAEWNGHLILLLTPINLAAVLMTVPEAQREKAGAQFTQSLQYMHAPLTIWPTQFGLETRSLMKTIERFVREPVTRQELASGLPST
jgi:hypothetical protein